MYVKDKRALVLGGGKSGLSAAKFLLGHGAAVDLYDDNPEPKPQYKEIPGANLLLGEAPNPGDYDFALISPGIPLNHKVAAALTEAGVEILGELELAARFFKAPIIGITGTNGKTTTTTLLGEILKNAGLKVFVGGNIGTPLLEAAGEEYDYFVVEMSSFQLETISKLDARVSLLLNLTPDHLNRHGTMEGYLAAKANLARCQSKENYTVLNYDDPLIASIEPGIKSKPVFFSQKETLYSGTFLQGDTIVFRYDSGDGTTDEKIMDRREIHLLGPHNLENAMGAITVAMLLNVEPTVIRDTLKSFKGVEHRMEEVATINGVTYINDSKATNPDSVLKALVSYGDTPIVLIAGGRNKGSNFDELSALIKEKVYHMVLVGECAEEMAASARKMGYEDFEIVADMAAAVAAATAKATPGTIVLLSPANASFDQFSCFEQRGEVFKDIVLKLKGRKTNGPAGKEETAT